jgi:hypothetical protein
MAAVVFGDAGMAVYPVVMNCYEDFIIAEAVEEILGLLDYMDVVDRLSLMLPPPIRRQHAVEMVELTGNDPPYDEIPVATRLDFTLIVDELDNGGLFGSA